MFLTTCSQMLSMNGSGKDKLHKTLEQRKGESCSLLSMSVRWNRLSNGVPKVTLSRRSQGAGVKCQDGLNKYEQASSLLRASVSNL